jgi:hypothetical protein
MVRFQDLVQSHVQAKLQVLLKRGLFHISIALDSTMTAQDIKECAKIINEVLLTAGIDHENLCLSVHVAPGSSIIKELIQTFTSHDFTCAIILAFDGKDRAAFAREVTEHSEYLSTVNCRLSLGVEKIEDPDELDWILSKIPQRSIEVLYHSRSTSICCVFLRNAFALFCIAVFFATHCKVMHSALHWMNLPLL